MVRGQQYEQIEQPVERHVQCWTDERMDSHRFQELPLEHNPSLRILCKHA